MGRVDIAYVAEYHGGGGHSNAAGYFVAYAVQPEAFKSPAQTLIAIRLAAILPAALCFATMAAAYA